jgi:alpha-D-ribose 1-methylphosphonate 5-triphosphate synthase subunit PhnL
MNGDVPFIGRKNELELIKEISFKENISHVICIEAEGGIGKTRLLQEIYSRYANRESWVLIINIIDFDDRIFHTVENIRLHISKKIGEKYFNRVVNLKKYINIIYLNYIIYS